MVLALINGPGSIGIKLIKDTFPLLNVRPQCRKFVNVYCSAVVTIKHPCKKYSKAFYSTTRIVMVSYVRSYSNKSDESVPMMNSYARTNHEAASLRIEMWPVWIRESLLQFIGSNFSWSVGINRIKPAKHFLAYTRRSTIALLWRCTIAGLRWRCTIAGLRWRCPIARLRWCTVSLGLKTIHHLQITGQNIQLIRKDSSQPRQQVRCVKSIIKGRY